MRVTPLALSRPISYGECVPARAPDHVTTEDLLAVTQSTRDTLYYWVARGLLPRPRIATDEGGRQFASWTPETLERVRFIVASQRQELTIEAIASLVEARWPRR
jgi:DNA-binding transcriptional MerR regulator